MGKSVAVSMILRYLDPHLWSFLSPKTLYLAAVLSVNTPQPAKHDTCPETPISLNWALEYHTLILFFLKEPL